MSLTRERCTGTVWTAAQISFIFSIYGSSSGRTNEARVILYPCCDKYLKTCQVLTLGPEAGGKGKIWVRKRMCMIYEIRIVYNSSTKRSSLRRHNTIVGYPSGYWCKELIQTIMFRIM